MEAFKALWREEKENPEKLWNYYAEKAMEGIHWFRKWDVALIISLSEEVIT
ncbi:MAG: hypothetical protein HA490_02430 [Archaeoglobales archaeon]|nr:hypothetical protein [Archaeoglobales archaeon]